MFYAILSQSMDTKFSHWLMHEMNKRELSQADLARASGLTRQAISYYLAGKSKQPDEIALQQIARAFKISVEEIYRAAGILPPVTESSARSRQVEHLLSQLPPEEYEGMVEYIKLRLKLSEGKHAKKKKATDGDIGRTK